MKTLKLLIASIVLAAALPALAAEIEAPPPELSKATLVEMTATVEAVDPASRLVTLKGPQGRLLEVKAGNAINLNNIKKGDLVNVKYYRSMAVDVVAPGKTQSGSEPAVTTQRVTPESGTAPAGAVLRQERKTGKILSIDPYKDSITFVDDRGRWREMWMDKPELKHYLTDLKEGDTIQVTITEALAVSMEPR
jgi:translation elongation factor P/translation initiation factor 5A